MRVGYVNTGIRPTPNRVDVTISKRAGSASKLSDQQKWRRGFGEPPLVGGAPSFEGGGPIRSPIAGSRRSVTQVRRFDETQRRRLLATHCTFEAGVGFAGRGVWCASEPTRLVRLLQIGDVFARFGAFRRTARRMTPVVPNDANDRMIVGLLTARHPGGVELLYDRWSPLTYALALSILRNPAEAEKVVLDAFLTLWHQPERALEHAENLGAYLCTLVSCDARLRSLKCDSRPAFVGKVSVTPQLSRHPAAPPTQDEPRGAPMSRPEARGGISDVGLGSDR